MSENDALNQDQVSSEITSESKASVSKKTSSAKKSSKKVTKAPKVMAKKVKAKKTPSTKMEKILFFQENDNFGKRKNSPKFFINVRHIHVDGKDTWRRIGSVNNKIDLTKTLQKLADKLNASIDQAKAVTA